MAIPRPAGRNRVRFDPAVDGIQDDGFFNVHDKPVDRDLFAAAITALIFVRHRANIRRLLAGTENKIGRRKAT